MPKLVNIMRDGETKFDRRQLPLIVDEKITMIMDLLNAEFMCENPPLRPKDKEAFFKKFSMLEDEEVKDAFKVSVKRLLDIVSELVPCVGCRRSVERLFYQMKAGPGRYALYPLVVTSEGALILKTDVHNYPFTVGAMFQNYQGKLNDLSTSWSRSKKSSRCSLHSLDAQRYVRPPLGSGWRALWDCLMPLCKDEISTIETPQLLSTLETYLQKHRFCTECRTKVMKAYSLLVDNQDGSLDSQDCPHDVSTPCEKNKIMGGDNSADVVANIKEKGFVPSLYAGIKRCRKYNHLHVDRHTDYIMGLILAAEPELLGNRRERHAKTLEIAQEEVLVCVGLCIYERVHRIQLRLREEQMTSQLLALVAINALSTNFSLAVEVKQGISQLELLFQELSREDQMKQKRQQTKKLKKRRKKERKNAANACNSREDEEDEKDDDTTGEPKVKLRDTPKNSKISEKCDKQDAVGSKNDEDEYDDEENENDDEEGKETNLKNCYQKHKGTILTQNSENHNETLLKYAAKIKDVCLCPTYEKSAKKHRETSTNSPISSLEPRTGRIYEKSRKSLSQTFLESKKRASSGKNGTTKPVKPILSLQSDVYHSANGDYINENNNTNSINSNKNGDNLYSKFNDHKDDKNFKINISNIVVDSNIDTTSNPCYCCNSIQADCGYSSADNNIISTTSNSSSSSSSGSGESSVDSSEVACSEGFCNHEGTEECSIDSRQTGGGDGGAVQKRRINNGILVLSSASQSLQQMLSETTADKEQNADQRTGEYIIPVEEIQQYKSSMGRINEKRKELRQTLKSRFAQLCSQQQPDVLTTL